LKFIALVFFAMPAIAQEANQGIVSGFVYDPSQWVISGAEIGSNAPRCQLRSAF